MTMQPQITPNKRPRQWTRAKSTISLKIHYPPTHTIVALTSSANPDSDDLADYPEAMEGMKPHSPSPPPEESEEWDIQSPELQRTVDPIEAIQWIPITYNVREFDNATRQHVSAEVKDVEKERKYFEHN